MPRRPLTLTAYLAYARGLTATLGDAAAVAGPRPKGPLVWAHAQSTEDARALAGLMARLQQQRPDVCVLATGVEQPAVAQVTQAEMPSEAAADIRDFTAHWRPDLLLWTGQALRPALMHRLKEQGARLLMLGAQDLPFSTPAPIWVPDAGAATLALFDRIFAVDDAALRRLRRIGLSNERLSRAGPLTEATPPLDCSPDLHEEMAANLSGRPSWLAARIRAEEADDILRAHRRAARLAHRMLLILVPAGRDCGRKIAKMAAESGLRIAHWDDGEMPDENTQVLLTEDASELGLWYRLAPIAFLGGSLMPGAGGEDPLEAAAHGIAILYGPNVGRHLPSYSRLVDAGAARIVRDFDSLSAAVSQLVAPDRAAAMAHAGWDVVSQSAALTDELLDLIGDWLDRPDGRAA